MQNQQRKSEQQNVRGFVVPCRSGFVAVAAVCAILIAFSVASAGQAGLQAPSTAGFATKLSPELANLAAGAHRGSSKPASGPTVRVIVQFRQKPANEYIARVQALGGRFRRRLDLVQSAAFTVPVSVLAAMAAAVEVRSISSDHNLEAADDLTNTAVGADVAFQSGYDGTGVTVAVIDSGINDTHPDFSQSAATTSRVLYHQDFTGTSNRDAAGNLVYDTYGHGTHVAGILGGNGKLSNGQYRGVAPNVNFVDLRVLGPDGGGSDSNVISAIEQLSL